MKYNFTLPPVPNLKKPAWKEREQPAVIVSLNNTQRVRGIQASFIRDCRTTLPDAVYYHSRKGKYQVFGLVNYDNCSGVMAFYGKTWDSRPGEMSKIIPHGAGAVSLSYMPNEKAVLILNNGWLYKLDRYNAAVKMAVPLAARAVFAGQRIYTVEGRLLKEYSPKGRLIKELAPALPWSESINSGAVNYMADTVFVCNQAGRLAVINADNGDLAAEGAFADGGAAGFKIVGFNGELLMVASSDTKKIYWLDPGFNEVASAGYSSAIPGNPLLGFDGRDLIALEQTDGTLYSINIQDNWDYLGVVHTASKKVRHRLPAKLLDIDNIYILYCEYGWDKDKVKSVIGYLDENRKASDIMFDGLLLMVQTYNGRSFTGAGEPAGLPEWIWYLNTLMMPGGVYQLLDRAARETRMEAGLPDFKPVVFIGVPHPMDSLERYLWFIDETISKAAGYHDVTLAGFYHPEEFKPHSLCKKIKEYINRRGFKYIWSPGYPAKGSVVKNKSLFDAVFYQTGYPWGYTTSRKGKENELTLAMANIIKFGIHPNVESMNDTRRFTFMRDRIYTLWDVMLNYGVYTTTKLHFSGSSQLWESCFSQNPFERELYDLYHEFLRGRRRPGKARPLYNRGNHYGLTLPETVLADCIRIMPRFTRNPPHRKPRIMALNHFKIKGQGHIMNSPD